MQPSHFLMVPLVSLSFSAICLLCSYNVCNFNMAINVYFVKIVVKIFCHKIAKKIVQEGRLSGAGRVLGRVNGYYLRNKRSLSFI